MFAHITFNRLDGLSRRAYFATMSNMGEGMQIPQRTVSIDEIATRAMGESRPVIGIVPTLDPNEGILRMNNHYAQAIVAAGGAPVIIPFTSDVSVYESLLPRIDGFVLSGGQDISPVRYGGDITYGKLSELTPEREEVEYLLLSYAYQFDYPLLGICRGMQMINVFFGGTLYLDLEEQFDGVAAMDDRPLADLGASAPIVAAAVAGAAAAGGQEVAGAAGTVAAMPCVAGAAAAVDAARGQVAPPSGIAGAAGGSGSAGGASVAGAAGAAGVHGAADPTVTTPAGKRVSHWQTCDYAIPTHTVSIMRQSKLGEILGRDHASVNSMHHQAVRTVPPNLRATAYGPDGLVEGIEVGDCSFLMGVQWHPEYFAGEGQHMAPLWKALIDAARSARCRAGRCHDCLRIDRAESDAESVWPVVSFADYI